MGGFTALWVVGYGVVQTLAPRLLEAGDKPLADIAGLAAGWVALLKAIPALLASAAPAAGGLGPALTWTLVSGMLVFGGIFAVNLSLHFYVIAAFSEREWVIMDVGFYSMSNAAGRLVGMLLSGLSYQVMGLPGGRGGDGDAVLDPSPGGCGRWRWADVQGPRPCARRMTLPPMSPLHAGGARVSYGRRATTRRTVGGAFR